MNPFLTASFPLVDIFDNEVLAWALVSCGLAQLSKLFFELMIKKQWRPAVLLETGGMPSSHSALVMGAASGAGLELGFDHPSFAIACTLAFVVMYDASGIRRSAGYIAARVNELPKKTWTSVPETPLKESLGHSKLEVLVGSFLGPLIALPGIVFIGSPLDFIHKVALIFG